MVSPEGCSDVDCVDAGVFDIEEYGAVYIIDTESSMIIDTRIGKNIDRTLNALEFISIFLPK